MGLKQARIKGNAGVEIVFGLLLGIGCAVLDAGILWAVTKRAAESQQDAKGLVLRGFAARYLLIFAAVAAGLLLPMVDAFFVVVSLLVQKGILVVVTVLHSAKQ